MELDIKEKEKPREGSGIIAALALLAVLLTIGCAVAIGFAVHGHNKGVDDRREMGRMEEMVKHLKEEENDATILRYTWDDEVENMSADEYEEFKKRVMAELLKQDRNVEIEALSLKSQYARYMGFGKEVLLRHGPGPCRKVGGAEGGSEDLTILKNGLMFMTSGYYAKFEGKILMYNFHKPYEPVKGLTIVKGQDSHFDLSNFHPHGMSSWEEDGETYVYAVSHPPTEDVVEMFHFNSSSQILTHMRNFSSPNFNYMNDFVMVSKESFYITKFWRWRDFVRIRLEVRLLARFGEIMFFDGTDAKTLISGLVMPNGINMSPDGKYVYVAEFGDLKLRTYKRDITDNSLTELEVETGVDNIEVDPITGDMWIGCHPILHKLWEYDARGATGLTPSQVIRVKVKDGKIQDMIETYVNDGTEIPGSTSASFYNGKMVIGALAAEHIIVCDALAID
ncbi:hypothetical protein ScPMuIL_012689 [Solemya velum]